LGRDFAVFDGLGWVGSNMTMYYIFDDYTTYSCKGPCK